LIVPSIGAACLGMVMGWLVVYSLRRIEKVTVATLSATASVILGSAVSKFLDINQEALPFYPIGLVLGFTLYIVTLSARMRLSSQYELPQENALKIQENKKRMDANEMRIETMMKMLREILDQGPPGHASEETEGLIDSTTVRMRGPDMPPQARAGKGAAQPLLDASAPAMPSTRMSPLS
jgi:hypothetical protein